MSIRTYGCLTMYGTVKIPFVSNCAVYIRTLIIIIIIIVTSVVVVVITILPNYPQQFDKSGRFSYCGSDSLIRDACSSDGGGGGGGGERRPKK